ncbi:MAG: mechanosensitive ion channel [Candidatus Thiodiazotropha sp.]
MSLRQPISLRLIPLLLCLLFAGAHALAADTSTTSTPNAGSNDITPSQVESAKSIVQSDKSLDDSQRSTALEMLTQTSSWLQQADKLQDDMKQLEDKVRNAPKLIAELQRKTNGNGQPDKIEAFIQKADLPSLELRISQDGLALSHAREQQKQQLDELSKLLVGSKQINDQIDGHSKTLAQIKQDLGNLPQGEPKSLTTARRLSLESRQLLRQRELDLLKLKLGNLSLLTNLAQAQRDNSATEINRLQNDLDALNKAASALRETQATKAREAAEQLQEETANLPEPLKIVADENTSDRAELEQLVYREKQVTQTLANTKQQLDEIKTDFDNTRQRVEVVGSSQAIGSMLYRRREALPSFRTYSRSSAERKKEINSATDRQINIDELLRDRGDVQNMVQHIMQSLGNDLDPKEKTKLEELTQNLVQARREALNELQKVYSRYIAQLTSLDLAERQLVEVSSSYINYINDQLIWISSGTLLNFSQLGDGLVWIFSPDKWLQLGSDLVKATAHRPAMALLVVLAVYLLAWKHRAAGEKLPELAKSTRKIRTDTFPVTIRALLYTLVRIGTLPILMTGLGLLLKMLPTAAPFSVAFADALINVGITLIAALLLREVCRPEGVGPRHLRWNRNVTEPFSNELRWAIPVLTPIRFVIAMSAGANLPAEAQTVGRLAIIALMVGTLVFMFRLLHRQSPMMSHWREANQDNLLAQLHFLWFPLLLIVSAGLIFTTGLGYQTLALRLLEDIEVTFWFFIGLFFLKELLLRYLFVAERRLRYENALRKRDELRAQREQEAQAPQPAEDEAAAIAVEIPEVNFDALSEQAKRLVRFGYLFGAVIGTWMIWGDLLPALDFLNQITLPISTSRLVDGVSTETPLTLTDLLVGTLSLLVTLLAAKNLPGVLEITLLQRLPLDAGARYALTTLLQYLIVGIGVITGFSTIGFQWSSIQWMVAALGVGLGFGLQEIVANFISGIILLFERPIRVGDVVTLDNTTGVVSRIRIRATTIINYDKQEMLIPNKEFITGRVINWTLTDKVNRVMINVGVAYGSDVSLAMSLMLEAARENENVLVDPAPVATFEAFGDNTLNLVLRTYLGAMENRLATITALHEAINRKFNAARISIAFPQRDVHLDTSTPLDIRISRTPRPSGR